MRVRQFLTALGLVALLALAAAGALWQRPESAKAAGLGDVDCNSRVNSIDAALVLQLDAGLIDVLLCQQNADVNQDLTVNSIDATLILQSDAGLIPGKPSTPRGPLGAQGLAYGPFRDGQAPGLVYPTSDEIRDDLSQLLSVTSRMRTFGSAGPMRKVAVEAAALGFSVTAGAYLESEKAANENEEEIAAVIDLANEGLVQSVVVGNETQLFGALGESQLLDYINQVKSQVPDGVSVTTAEPPNIWLQRPQLVEAVDYVLMNIYPFWEGRPIDGAAAYAVESYLNVRTQTDKPVVIGETGWPSGGTPEQAGLPPNVMPSEENQRRYFEEFAQLAESYGIEYYWFAAYDEEWKWSEGFAKPDLPLDRDLSGRFVGSSWGIFRSDGRIKPRLDDLFPLAAPSTSRLVRTIFDDRGLAVMYDMGVDTSHQRRDWLERTEEGMRMAYPADQDWGAVFITVGPPVDPPRPWKDFSSFGTLSVDLHGEVGGESLEIGIKDSTDPDTGRESRVLVSKLSTSWQTYQFPLALFETADMEGLYVVAEFVFSERAAQTVYFRNVEYLP